MLERVGVLELFGRQHGVATIEQLITPPLEINPWAVDRARRRGAVVAVMPGVLRLAGHELSLHGRAMALLLKVGPGSYLSGPTAARLHGLRGMPDEPVEITQRENQQHRLPTWARYARTSWPVVPAEELAETKARAPSTDEAGVVEIDGLRVAGPLRMLFGLAAQFGQRRFERAAEDAWHRGLVTPDEAADYLQQIRGSGRAGVIRMQTWLEKTDARPSGRPSQSNFELDVIEALLDRGLPEPVRQHPLMLLSRETVHIDIAWPEARYGVEPGHSWWHGGDERTRRDQARDRACGEVGWLITRLDEQERERLPAIAAQVERTYLARRPLVG